MMKRRVSAFIIFIRCSRALSITPQLAPEVWKLSGLSRLSWFHHVLVVGTEGELFLVQSVEVAVS